MLHTNMGELTHKFISKNKADVVFKHRTFYNDEVPASYAHVCGYSERL